MGRLFWKFFFFVWLAQLSAIATIATIFWLERQQDMARWQTVQGVQGAQYPDGPPHWRPRPGDAGPPPPPDGRFSPPPPGGPPHPPLPLVPLLATLLASLVFAALLAWYFAKPIRSLRAAFAAAATGDLGQRLGETMGRRRDELADLGRDFDRMTGQLQLLMAGQRRLLHDVSHEMRSPLARLQAAVGLLRQQPENVVAGCERIERECGRMDHLVGELLTLSRLEAGVSLGANEEIDLAELLADIVEDARFEAKGRHIELEVSGPALMLGNAELLQRAIENVVRNALRHTPDGSHVQVVFLVESEVCRIAVLDRGAGVAEEELETIFQPFQRTAQRTEHGASSSGHGLGLAIAREVIEAHGGRIRAYNREGGGLCVEMLLPQVGGTNAGSP